MTLWQTAEQRSFWFRSVRSSSAAWTKCWDIAADIPRNNSASVAQQAGFQVEKILKFNRPGVPAWWLNGKLMKRRTFGMGQIRLLNALTPLFRLIDPWLPLPPLSIIAILRKWDRQDHMLAFDTKAAS